MVRDIIVTVDSYGNTDVGNEPQYAGVQGEHNLCQIAFDVTDWVTGGEDYAYRGEYVDGNGYGWTTDIIEPVEESGSYIVSYNFPGAWTAAGGKGVARLVASTMVDNVETERVYVVDVPVYFKAKQEVDPQSGRDIFAGLTGLIADVHGAADYATAQGDYAKAKGDDALTAGAYANGRGQYAQGQGDYAKAQGDYAKDKGDAAALAESDLRAAAARGDFDGADGADGGYYAPSVNAAGDLSWTASDPDMPPVAGTNIKGPQGDTGATGPQGPQGVGLVEVTGVIVSGTAQYGYQYDISLDFDSDNSPTQIMFASLIAYGLGANDSVKLWDKNNVNFISTSQGDLTADPGEHLFLFDQANTVWIVKGDDGKDAAIDDTLTIEGEAADAKATGDAIHGILSLFDKSSTYSGTAVEITADAGSKASVSTAATTVLHSNSRNLIDPTWVNDGTNTKRIYGQMVGKNTVNSGAVYGTASSPINQVYPAGTYRFTWSSTDATFDGYINNYGMLEYSVGGVKTSVNRNTAFTVASDFTLIRLYLSDTMNIVAGRTYDYTAQIEPGSTATAYEVPTAAPTLINVSESPFEVNNFTGRNVFVGNASMDVTVGEFGANLIDDSKSTDYTTYSSEMCHNTFAPIPTADTPFEATKATFSGSDVIRIASPHAKRNYTISFSAHITTFGNKITIGIGGKSNYVSGWIEIDSTDIKVYTKESSSSVLAGTYAHGLTFSQTINVNIHATGISTAEIVLSTVGGQFKTNTAWFGSLGTAFNGVEGRVTAETDGGVFTDCIFKYYAAEYKHDVWGFGDSYFDHWPAVAIANGYGNFAIDGVSGRHSKEAWTSLELETAKRLPKAILWAMGMNDEDTGGVVNSNWKKVYDDLTAFCDTNHIELILCTIPCVPSRDNSYKNAIIKASGHRYVDIADAVGGSTAGSTWYTGLLSSDNVHPSVAGDKAIAARVMADVPELMDE